MDLRAILDLYDCDQRRDAEPHGMRREVTDTVVRLVALHDLRGYVVHSRLTAGTADEVIREQMDYFARVGQMVEWTAFSHDSPPDLTERLRRHGFEPEETETIVVLELEMMSPAVSQPVAHEVRRIRDVAGLSDVLAAKRDDSASESEDRALSRRLKRELEEIPDRLSVYVAYCDGVPACSGWIRFDPASPFASLWGGSTRSKFRHRGLYTALVATRAQEARERGVRFLTVDAQSLSRPILEKLGFRVLTVATPMIWRPPEPPPGHVDPVNEGPLG